MSRVYCVEDDESIRELIVYALTSSGYEAEGFESGTDFFSKVYDSIPNLILLDVMLPGEDGLEILKKLKSSPTLKDIPIIFP